MINWFGIKFHQLNENLAQLKISKAIIPQLKAIQVISSQKTLLSNYKQTFPPLTAIFQSLSSLNNFETKQKASGNIFLKKPKIKRRYIQKFNHKKIQPSPPMSSSQQINIIVPARNKLTLDSQQQERREQQQRQRLQEIQKRKQQKRKRREQVQKAEMEKIKQQEQKEKKYEQPQMMFEPDSDDGVEFKRVVKKIKRAYPEAVNKYQVQKKRNDFIVPDNEDDDESEQESGSYNSQDDSSSQTLKKVKKQHKSQKKQKRVQKKPQQKRPVQKKKIQPQVKKQKVKIEHRSDRKQHLVKQVSVRWWYALPQWPPVDFDYNGKLKQLGYRVLDAEKFKLQEDVVNGLAKCVAVDGYKGVYKTKTLQKLIDVRPKQSAPTLNNFRNKSIQQLTEILKRALTVQIQQLKQVKHQQKGQAELLTELERQLIRLK